MRECAQASGSSAAVQRSSALGSMRGVKLACTEHGHHNYLRETMLELLLFNSNWQTYQNARTW